VFGVRNMYVVHVPASAFTLHNTVLLSRNANEYVRYVAYHSDRCCVLQEQHTCTRGELHFVGRLHV
jgi:hypothetical protein